MYLGYGLHAIQDIQAHGQIGQSGDGSLIVKCWISGVGHKVKK